MTSEDGGRISRLTLMCRDHEVVEFAWSHLFSKVVGKSSLRETAYVPYGCMDSAGKFTSTGLTAWMVDRAIPDLRPSARERLDELGYSSAADLLASGFGLSLSDQFWLRPEGSDARWDDVNCFENDFPQEFGELLLPHDNSSVPELVNRLKASDVLLKSSPDTALNGNLPKRWRIESDGTRVLVKAGRPGNRYQEPFNEAVVTDLCARLLAVGDFVPYVFEDGGFASWTCACPTMVDARTELVPGYQIYKSHKRGNSESLRDFFNRVCAEHDVDSRESVEKMLVVDFLVANFDRHWSNFGVLIDTETRQWLRVAPIFDTGESLWCDRETREAFGGYKMPKQGMNRPFSRDLDSQVERFCGNLKWYDPNRLAGFCDFAIELLRKNPFVANDPGRIEKIHESLQERIRLMNDIARRAR